MKKNVLLVALSLLLMHSSTAADSSSKAPSATDAPTAERRAQLVDRAQQRIKRIDAALESVKWDVAVPPAVKYSDTQIKAETEFNAWMNTLRTKLQHLRREIERGANSKDFSAAVKMLREQGESDAAVQLMIQQTMDRYQRWPQALSSASKARYDAVIAALRNLLG